MQSKATGIPSSLYHISKRKSKSRKQVDVQGTHSTQPKSINWHHLLELFLTTRSKVLEKEFMFMPQYTFSNNPSEEKSFLIHTQYLIYCSNYTAV